MQADLRLKALTMYIVEVALHDVKFTEEKPSLLASTAIHLGDSFVQRVTSVLTPPLRRPQDARSPNLDCHPAGRDQVRC